MNDFDSWNILKQKINLRVNKQGFYTNKGDVWMALLGQNIGSEENGKGGDFSRPILIVRKFNTQMVWAIPLSSKQKGVSFYYNFTDPLLHPAALILSQLRLISTKRLKRKLYKFPLDQLTIVRNRLKSYL